MTEQRDELDVSVSHAWGDLAVHAGYRLSIENDYDSSGLSAGSAYDFADNAARVELSVNAFHDLVGRSGQPDFARRLDTLNSRLSLTQVLDPGMFVQLTYEPCAARRLPVESLPLRADREPGHRLRGRRAVPARARADARIRHAFAAVLRRAFGAAFSLGATYRIYFDDWALRSHTVLAELGWNAGEHTLLALHFRYYTQGAVDFYQERYTQLPAPFAFLTHDRELSAMSAERLGVDLEHGIVFDDGGKTLTLSLSLGGALFNYDEFVGLTSVRALELTTALALAL